MELGFCMPSQIVGLNCSTHDDCEGVRELSVDGGHSRRERAFCVQGKCRQCNPETWHASWGVPVGMEVTCPGYNVDESQEWGVRYYENSQPGSTRACLADGSLVAGGVINFNLADEPSSASSIFPLFTFLALSSILLLI